MRFLSIPMIPNRNQLRGRENLASSFMKTTRFERQGSCVISDCGVLIAKQQDSRDGVRPIPVSISDCSDGSDYC